MARAAGKPKPPPYPRPVPDIHAEEITAEPTDSVSYDDQQSWLGAGIGFGQHNGEDAEAYVERRAAKRRRIEANAQAYLRGQPLCIMSARLKGPFNKGWKNPWSTRFHAEQVISRTLGEDGKDNNEQVTPQNGIGVVDEMQSKWRSVNAAHKRWLSRKTASQEKEQAVTKPIASDRDRASATGMVQDNEDDQQDGRVEHWLRTNNVAAVDHDVVLTQSSPLPAGRADKSIQVLRSFEDQSSEEETHRQIVSTTYERIQQLSRNMSKIMQTPRASTANDEARHIDGRYRADLALKRAGNPTINDGGKSLHPAKASNSLGVKSKQVVDDNANHSDDSAQTVLPVKTRFATAGCVSSVHHAVAPPIYDNSSSHFAKADDIEQMQTKTTGDDMTDIERVQIAATLRKSSDKVLFYPLQDSGASESISAALGGTLVHASAATSDFNTSDALPSAQRVSNLQSSTSSGLLAVQMIEEECAPPDPEHLQSSGNVTQNNDSNISDSAFNLSLRVDALNPVSGFEHDVALVRTHNQKLATNGRDALIQDIGSLQDVANPAEASITTRPLKMRSQAAGYATDQISRMHKKRKRAFSANNLHSSNAQQHSLKQMPRVKVVKLHGSPAAFSVNKDCTSPACRDQEGDDTMIDSNPFATNGGIGTQKQRKGILKSTNPTNSQNSNRQFKIMGSASQQQEGQGDKFLEEVGKAVIDDDEFDLEAAIDDLGSFLGSWDAEKEASGIIG